MRVGQLSESDAVDALRLPFSSSRHARGSNGRAITLIWGIPATIHGGTVPPRIKPPLYQQGPGNFIPWAGQEADYTTNVNLIKKVLDFIQLGGPGWTCEN